MPRRKPFFVAFSLPDLPWQVLAGQAQPQQALAVEYQSKILQACPQARAQGVHPGQSRSLALAVCPELCLQPAQPALEQQSLHTLASQALAFTPHVFVHLRQSPGAQCPHQQLQPSQLLLEVAASLRLFGGLRALITQLQQMLQVLGLPAQLAAAPTALAASWMAWLRPGRCIQTAAQLQAELSTLPAWLVCPFPLQERLAPLGLQSLEDLRAIPAAELTRRFGPEPARLLAEAWGEQVPARAQPFVPPEQPSWLIEPQTPIGLSTTVFKLIEQLILPQVQLWLKVRQRAWAEGRLVLQHSRRITATQLPILQNQAQAGVQALRGLLQESLGRLQLPDEVQSIQLGLLSTQELPGQSHNLFAGLVQEVNHADQQQAYLAWLDGIQARLGQQALKQLALQADHRPEQASHLGSACGPTPPTSAPSPAAAAQLPGLPRPFWLLHPPRPLQERHEQPWLQGPLALLAGPERIECGWWDEQAPVLRDYFIAQDAKARRFWIFQQRQLASSSVLLEQESSRWWLHGLYG